MAMIKQNNKILQKYTVSPTINYDTSKRLDTDIREYSSINTNPPQGEALKDYFTSSGQDNSGSNYNQEYKLPPLVANMNNLSSKLSNNSNPNDSNPQLERKLSNKFNSQK
jgi:hypothetical protein